MIELIQNSTIHGINHIYSASSKIIKLFWILLFLSGIIGIIINFCFVVIKYKSAPIFFSYTPNDEVFIWPDLTFCFPSSPYELNEFRVDNYWKQVLDSSQSIVRNISNESHYLNIIAGASKNDSKPAARIITMSTADPQQLIVDEFIYKRFYVINCRLLPWRVTRRLYLPTSREMMNKAYSTRIHQLPNNIPCFTLHMDELFELNGVNAGNVSSVNIYLNYNQKSHEIFNSSYHGRSVLLYLHRKKEFSTENPILIYPGYRNQLTISQTRYHYLAGGKSNCRSDSYQADLYDAMLQSTRPFHINNQADCLTIAKQQMVVNQCNCYSPYLPIYKNKTGFPSLCLNTTIFSNEQILNNSRCMLYAMDIYWYLRKSLAEYSCSKCNSINYKVEKEKTIEFESRVESSDDWFTRHWKEFLNIIFKSKTESELSMRNNLVELEITKYRDKGDSYKEEYSYRFSELLSDIGGLMGLWLGMSVIGLFEVVQLACLYFRKICCKSQNVPPSPLSPPQSGTLAEPVQLITDNKLL